MKATVRARIVCGKIIYLNIASLQRKRGMPHLSDMPRKPRSFKDATSLFQTLTYALFMVAMYGAQNGNAIENRREGEERAGLYSL